MRMSEGTFLKIWDGFQIFSLTYMLTVNETSLVSCEVIQALCGMMMSEDIRPKVEPW